MNRRKIIKVGGITLVVLFLVIQVIPVSRTNPPVEEDVTAPAEVKRILRGACYDCHSNETVWPWYSYVAPFSWLVAYDVSKGREELNFSTWNRYDTKQQFDLLAKSLEEVDEGEMPPWFYTGIHRDVKMSSEDKKTFRQWALQKAPVSKQ